MVVFVVDLALGLWSTKLSKTMTSRESFENDLTYLARVGRVAFSDNDFQRLPLF